MWTAESTMVAKVVENKDVLDISPFILPGHNKISPLNFFDPKPNSKTVLLILNQAITLEPSFFKKVWNNCDLRICADGGSNQLRKFDSSYIPEYIVGDLDSATSETLNYYRTLGSKTLLQSTQDATDLDKCLSLINLYFNYNSEIEKIHTWDTKDGLVVNEDRLINDNPPDLDSKINVVILGAIGGRFDQTINAISKVWKISLSRPYISPILLNPEHSEVILLIPKGFNFVSYPRLTMAEELEYFGTNLEKSKHEQRIRNVGILPLIAESVITTKGLKWDVTDWPTSMLGNVSSCNLQVGEQGFIIETENPIYIDFEL